MSQLDMTERRKKDGLLQPQPIGECPWDSIYMDFTSGFPKVDGIMSIMVLVDRLSKNIVFIDASTSCSCKIVVELFY